MPKRLHYRVPEVSFWKSDVVSESFIRVQLKLARNTHNDTDKDLANLDADILAVQQEIRAKWASANVQVMRGFEQRLRQIKIERRYLFFIRKRLENAIDAMLGIGDHRGWKL